MLHSQFYTVSKCFSGPLISSPWPSNIYREIASSIRPPKEDRGLIRISKAAYFAFFFAQERYFVSLKIIEREYQD